MARWVMALALLVPVASSYGCGGSNEDPKHAKVKAADMPADGDWTGVYYSPVYGNLHLVKEGNAVNGKWRTAAGDKWGELHGEVTGDLLRYQWSETTIGMVGPSAKSNGKGYFKYVVPKEDNAPHEIHGEWGLKESEVGSTWDAIKQVNQQPDPDSVMPDETQKVHSTGWDEGSSGGGSEGNSEQEEDEEEDDWD